MRPGATTPWTHRTMHPVLRRYHDAYRRHTPSPWLPVRGPRLAAAVGGAEVALSDPVLAAHGLHGEVDRGVAWDPLLRLQIHVAERRVRRDRAVCLPRVALRHRAARAQARLRALDVHGQREGHGLHLLLLAIRLPRDRGGLLTADSEPPERGG